MATLKEIRKRFSKQKRIKLRSKQPISEPDDLKDPCVFTCPSGLVVRIKPMRLKDKDYLKKIIDHNQSAIKSIAQWLQSRTEVIDPGPYGSELVDWKNLYRMDFDAICTATKEATYEC